MNWKDIRKLYGNDVTCFKCPKGLKDRTREHWWPSGYVVTYTGVFAWMTWRSLLVSFVP